MTNPRPPRKKTNRNAARRVAGHPRPGSSAPAGSGPESPDLADGTPESADGTPDRAEGTPDLADGTPDRADGTLEAAEGTPEPADGTPDLADGTPDLADGTPDLADGTPDLADGTPDLADGTPDLADGTPDLADGTPEPADGTPEPADGTPEPADGTPEPADKPRPTAKKPVARVSTLRPSDPAAASASGSRRKRRFTSSAPGSGRRRTIAILLAAAVILGIFALIAGLHPGAKIGANKAFVDQAATTELTSQVQSKACNLTVDTADVNKWADKARSVLTGEARSEFDKYLPQQREILQQTKAIADCRVESVGVADLSGGGDGDTARVVVNMIVSQEQAGIAGQSAAPRYQFAMVKQGDDWLINKVEAF